MEAAPEHLRKTKNMPVRTLTETVEQLTRDNGRLRLELAHAQETCAALTRFVENVTHIKASLSKALHDMQKASARLDETGERGTGEEPTGRQLAGGGAGMR